MKSWMLDLRKVATAASLSLGLPSPESGVCTLVHPFREAQDLQRHRQVTQLQVWVAPMVFMPSKMCKEVPHTFCSVEVGCSRARRGNLASLQLATSKDHTTFRSVRLVPRLSFKPLAPCRRLQYATAPSCRCRPFAGMHSLCSTAACPNKSLSSTSSQIAL